MRVKEAGMDGSKANYHFIQDKVNEKGVVMSESSMPALPVLYLKDCRGCEFILPQDTSVVKVLVEGCSDCLLTLKGKITTDTLEIWRCSGVQLVLDCSVATLQADLSTDISIKFASRDQFSSVVHAGVRGLSLEIQEEGESAVDASSVGYDVQVLKHPNINDTSDQFITRFVEGHGLLTEQIIRLKNDFPTTAREQAEYAERLASNAKTLGGEGLASEVLESLGNMMSPEEEVHLRTLQARQEEAAQAARAEAEEEVSDLARIQFKKTQGTEAFKEGRYQDAAVLYTEALTVLPNSELHNVLLANCAMCFLKLGRYQQALEHCDASIALTSSNAKTHFRRGLALQALERFNDAFCAFEKVLEIEPSNSQAKAGLKMCQMQIERQRMKQ